jgi:hypothetical protein
VIVRLRLQNGNLFGQVQDTGIGIPEAMDGLFTEFSASNAKALQHPWHWIGSGDYQADYRKSRGRNLV